MLDIMEGIFVSAKHVMTFSGRFLNCFILFKKNIEGIRVASRMLKVFPVFLEKMHFLFYMM